MSSLASVTSPTLTPRASTAVNLSIRRSWQRCQKLASTLHHDPDPLILADLNIRREQHAHFLEVAQPELTTLASLVTSANSVVLLADTSGVILEQTGDTDFLHKAEEVALQPGVNWAESMRGTNAIGTALMDGAAVSVHGAEHFLERNRILSCHAAPVFSPRGDIAGVLDISGDANILHAYALGLAQMCARKISNRLLETAQTRLRRLVFQQQSSLLDSDERAILLLEDETIVGANNAALHLLGTDWRLLDTSIHDWLENIAATHATTGSLFTKSGQMLLGKIHTPEQHTQAPGTKTSTTTLASKTARTSTAPTTAPLAARPDIAASAPLPQLPQAVTALNGGLAVMLQGETGAGKEVFARHLHQHSLWCSGPFVAVNCGALPETLIESELFGYEAGAFTGAKREGALGRLREANGGILFLDEIGDMPLLLQTRLLRALQEREVQPLGSDKRIPVNFALISASNRDLDAMMADGAFRNDLYYRLQDYKVRLHPLREHPQLRQFLCTEFRRLGSQDRGMTLSDPALDALSSWQWPGNYREMHSVLRTLLCLLPPGSLVQAHDLPPEIQAHAQASSTVMPTIATPEAVGNAKPDSIPNKLRALNQHAIGQALATCGNNVSQAARQLGVHRSTLYRYLAQRQIAQPLKVGR